MKAVEITELPEVEVSEEGLIPIVDPLNGVSRVKLKHARGLSIQSQETFFLVSNTNTGVTIETSGWVTTPSPTTATSRYLWSYTKYTYNDNSVVNTAPAVIGVYGDKGDKGDKGDTGNPFTIAKTYTSIAEMNNSFATDGIEEGSFVVIDTGDINDEDNAKLYLKGSTAYMYITDMSGIQGIQGPKGDKGDKGDQGEKGDKGESGVTVDTALSSSSTNPVQNKVVTGAMGTLSSLTTTEKSSLVSAINELDTKTDFKVTSMVALGFTAGSTVQVEDFLQAVLARLGVGGIRRIEWHIPAAANVTDGTTTVNINAGVLLWGGGNNFYSNSWSEVTAVYHSSSAGDYKFVGRVEANAGVVTVKKITRLDPVPPINHVYTQYSGQTAPATLYANTTWSNITSSVTAPTGATVWKRTN